MTIASLRDSLDEQQRNVRVARKDVLEHAVMARRAEANRAGQDELELTRARARFEEQQQQQQTDAFALMSRQSALCHEMRLAGDRLVAVHAQSKRASALLAQQQRAVLNSPLVSDAAHAMLNIADYRMIADDASAALGIAGASLGVGDASRLGSAARIERVLQELRLLQREVEESTRSWRALDASRDTPRDATPWTRYSVEQIRREIASARQLRDFAAIDAPQRTARTALALRPFGAHEVADFDEQKETQLRLNAEIDAERLKCATAEREATARLAAAVARKEGECIFYVPLHFVRRILLTRHCDSLPLPSFF